MPRPHRAEALSDARLTSDVCLSVAYIGPKSRTERPRKTKIGTEIAHVTRDLSRSKGQGHQAALLSAALTRKAAAAVSVGTYSAQESSCYVASARRRATGEERGGAYCVATRTAYY